MMHVQSLGFDLRIARTANDLKAACRVRSTSYGHHVPRLDSALSEPDLLDFDEHTVVFLCVDRSSGEAVGTLRVQTNGGGPLLIEHSVAIPQPIGDDTRAEVTRLSAVAGADPLVKLVLMKASYLYCLAAQVRWMVIGARSDALVRQYKRLGFFDLFGEGHSVALQHAARLPHKVLAFDVTSAESVWRSTAHPLYAFMIQTAHPAIQLFSTRPALPPRPARVPHEAPSWSFEVTDRRIDSGSKVAESDLSSIAAG